MEQWEINFENWWNGQPMKDFEKEFYYNWTGDKEEFHKVKNWFGEWCKENISNFLA